MKVGEVLEVLSNDPATKNDIPVWATTATNAPAKDGAAEDDADEDIPVWATAVPATDDPATDTPAADVPAADTPAAETPAIKNTTRRLRMGNALQRVRPLLEFDGNESRGAGANIGQRVLVFDPDHFAGLLADVDGTLADYVVLQMQVADGDQEVIHGVTMSPDPATGSDLDAPNGAKDTSTARPSLPSTRGRPVRRLGLTSQFVSR